MVVASIAKISMNRIDAKYFDHFSPISSLTQNLHNSGGDWKEIHVAFALENILLYFSAEIRNITFFPTFTLSNVILLDFEK